MDDEKQAVNQQESTTFEASPTSETVEVNTPPQESETQETADNIKSLEQSQEQKPSRLEKRLRQLSERKSKIEETLKKLFEKTGFKPTEVNQPESLIKPEDYEQGITPEELEARIKSQQEAYAEEVKNEIRAELEYKNKVQEHISDVENLRSMPEFNKSSDEYDPEFEDFITQQYQVLNNMIDPVSGATIFVPRVKMSDLYKAYKPLVEKWKERGGMKSMAKTIDEISSSAIAPTIGQSSEVSVEDLRRKMWENPSEVVKYLEKKLK